MKYLVLFTCLFIQVSFAQQSNEKKLNIEINERASFYEVNNKYELLTDTIYYSKSGFLINSDFDIENISGDDYVIITYPNYKNGSQNPPLTTTRSPVPLAVGVSPTPPVRINLVDKDSLGNTTYVNGKTLAIKKSDYDNLDKTIQYSTNWKNIRNYNFSSGLLTIPFKLRPKIDSTNFNITTDITIGSYFGVTKRLSKRKRFYLTLPVTLGLSFINIDNNNTSNVNFDDDDIGIVPGITWSSGLIFQLNDFNIGFVAGQDFASGIGENWRYNGEFWYSFAIGYNFLKQKEK